MGMTKRHATDRLREAEDTREIYVCIDTDRLREAEEQRLREAEIGLGRTMVKWKIDKYYKLPVCKSYKSYLFVHWTHWKFVCSEVVILYCVEVLRICKCNDLHETFCRVQETIDRLGAWLVICIEMHVLLSVEKWNLCESNRFHCNETCSIGTWLWNRIERCVNVCRGKLCVLCKPWQSNGKLWFCLSSRFFSTGCGENFLFLVAWCLCRELHCTGQLSQTKSV